MTMNEIKFMVARFVGNTLTEEEILNKLGEYIMLLNVQTDPEQKRKTRLFVMTFMNIFMIKTSGVQLSDLKAITEIREKMNKNS